MESSPALVGSEHVLFLFRLSFVVFAALYFIFSLIIIRQVSLMAETVQTQFGGLLRLLSLIFALSALGILIYFVMRL